jgi:succinate dehydrogenase/fumarate reductase flavoprotein subunit
VSSERFFETDVLIIGGGIAGCFAAIKAKEKGVNVTLVDKGYVGKSGSSAYPDTYCVFNPEWGHDLDAWMNYMNVGGEYLNNREWTEIIFKDSYAMYQDLKSWGVQFLEENGEPIRWKMDPLGACETLQLGGKYEAGGRRNTLQVLRKQALARGVKIMDRIMVTDLLKTDGRVVGAVGIPLDSSDLYVFKAKATIISTGCAGFKPDGWPIMAYRAGAEIMGNEFPDTHYIRADYPGSRAHNRRLQVASNGRRMKRVDKARRITNAEGDEVKRRGLTRFWLEMEIEAHAGRAPISTEIDAIIAEQLGEDHTLRVVGCAAGGMSIHTTEGVWPLNTKCATSIPGLYAAGDSLGTMQVGAVYTTIGVATAGASVTGTRAGVSAAEYALQAEKPVVDEDNLAKLKTVTQAPLERKGGFSPRWVTQVLQNITRPYFILYIKQGKRLEAALTLVEFLRDHLVPKLTANDPHELRLAHETKNMILNAEMKLRSSLYRTESRGCHYREDYPRRDDPNWLAWVILREENEKMTLSKRPIPKEWWPDLSKPYEERYPVRFPGE